MVGRSGDEPPRENWARRNGGWVAIAALLTGGWMAILGPGNMPLLAAGVLVPEQLRRLFEAIQVAYATRSVKADPARFRRGLEAVLGPGG